MLRKLEALWTQNLREILIKKYKKTYILGSMAFVTFWIDIVRGKMKMWNRYNNSSYSCPASYLYFHVYFN